MAFAVPKTKSLSTLLGLLDITVQVLNFIAKATKSPLDDQAPLILSAVRAALAQAEAGFAGKTTPEKVREALAELRTAIAANDKLALERLRKKFGRQS